MRDCCFEIDSYLLGLGQVEKHCFYSLFDVLSPNGIATRSMTTRLKGMFGRLRYEALSRRTSF